MKKIACITGASSGIGRATAQRLAELGFALILCGRRKERLEALAKDLNTDTCILSFDIQNPPEVQDAIESLAPEWQEIEVLVNNAGLAVGLSTLADGVMEDWERMINTNLKGLLYISRAIIPGMISRQKGGHILNISSIAGKEVYPNGNVYCATKHAVDALSKSMRIELAPHQIKVTNVAPGMVETEFSLVRFKGNEQKAEQVYTGMQPLKAEDIADIIAFAVSRPAHVCLNDILVMPTAQPSSTIVHRK